PACVTNDRMGTGRRICLERIGSDSNLGDDRFCRVLRIRRRTSMLQGHRSIDDPVNVENIPVAALLDEQQTIARIETADLLWCRERAVGRDLDQRFERAASESS